MSDRVRYQCEVDKIKQIIAEQIIVIEELKNHGGQKKYKVRFSTQSIFCNYCDLNYTMSKLASCQTPRSRYCETNWPS